MIDANYDKRGFYIATVDNYETTIYGENKAAVMAVAEDLIELVKEQIADNDYNYGLSFYACSYNGLAQNNFIKYYADKYGVTIF